MAEKVNRISILNQISLLIVFPLMDAVQAVTKLLYLIPVFGAIAAILIGILISLMALIAFSIWMPVIGIPLFNGFPLLMTTTIMELVPLLNALPGWTTLVVATIFVVNRKAKYNEKKNNESV